jgi:hypothetical protein
VAKMVLIRRVKFKPYLDVTWTFTSDLEVPDGELEPMDASKKLREAIWTRILKSGLYHPPKWWQWWRWFEERPPADLCPPKEKEDLPPLPEPHGD